MEKYNTSWGVPAPRKNSDLFKNVASILALENQRYGNQQKCPEEFPTKVKFMKTSHSLFLIILLFFTGTSVYANKSGTYTKEELIFKAGILYEKQNNTPVNGVYRAYYESGILELETSYKDGKINGFEKHYYDSGELKAELRYENGEMSSDWKKFYKSGRVKAETISKNGGTDGIMKEYYESGHLKAEIIIKDNKAASGYSYDEKGEKTEMTSASMQDTYGL